MGQPPGGGRGDLAPLVLLARDGETARDAGQTSRSGEGSTHPGRVHRILHGPRGISHYIPGPSSGVAPSNAATTPAVTRCARPGRTRGRPGDGAALGRVTAGSRPQVPQNSRGMTKHQPNGHTHRGCPMTGLSRASRVAVLAGVRGRAVRARPPAQQEDSMQSPATPPPATSGPSTGGPVRSRRSIVAARGRNAIPSDGGGTGGQQQIGMASNRRPSSSRRADRATSATAGGSDRGPGRALV